MQHSEQINDIAAALAAAQSQMGAAHKDGVNPHFRSKYATLSACWDAIREPLSANGLALIQTASTTEGGGITVTTLLAHSSGQWMRDSLTLAPTKGDPQGAGSAITYGRRYGLGIVGLVTDEDDDGNAASVPQPQRSAAQAQAPSAQPTQDQPRAPGQPNATATGKQIGFLCVLAKERNIKNAKALPHGEDKDVREWASSLTRRQASDVIEQLKLTPVLPEAADDDDAEEALQQQHAAAQAVDDEYGTPEGEEIPF